MATKISDTVNLRALEVLDELARTGSMQEAASRLNMSAPAASQQLKQLETELGHDLVVHNRRPMELTRSGHAYLVHVRAALQHLRQGASELLLDELGTIHSLRIGIIDDFDGEVSPQLAVKMADTFSTMVGYLRARRFHDRVDIHRLPFTEFSRTISLHYNSELTPRIGNIIAENLRSILQSTIVEPGHNRAPWLAETLTVVLD